MMKKIRVACYLRVSHEEQAKHGFSIATQKKHLDEYIKAHDEMILVDYYIDEGISADKLKKRASLQRLLKDVKDNKIDLIIFTKLDRWFRSVAKYYKIQEVLETNKVNWQAILEDYETITANGKFKVNIMLSVAQQERDKGSERIKDVFEYKVANGEAIVPSNATPFGFTVERIDGKNKIVHDENERVVYDLIQHYKTYKSKKKTMFYVYEKYDKLLDYQTLSKLLRNPLLYGCYRDNENYCQGYMTKDEFMEMQGILDNNRRETVTGRVYLFSSLLKCPVCGSTSERHMVGTYNYAKYKDKRYYSFAYKCENHYSKKQCTNNKTISEKKIEKLLLDSIKMHLERIILEYEVKEPKQTKKVDERKTIQNEIERLNKMYQKGRISEELYDKEYDMLESKLASVHEEDHVKDVSRLKDLLDTNILELYETLERGEKQAFWSGLIKHIYLEIENKQYKIKHIDFL